jgi:hypothetical protein
MLRVVDYFSAVDKNSDEKIEFEEAFGHCFPYVPDEQRDTLLKWLHPKRYDPDLYGVMEKFAMKKACPATDFGTDLMVLDGDCKEHLEAKKTQAEIERFHELVSIGKGFVSIFTLAHFLKEHGNFTSAAINWLEERKQTSDEKQKSDPSLIPNTFSATIFVISSAIQKLSRQKLHESPNPMDEVDGHLFRGLANLKAHGSGYCEFGFLSSNKNEEVAANIAYEIVPSAKSILVLHINAPIGGFACIENYSQ